MKTPAQPTPPDPVRTAQAQAQMNRETAVTQYGLNATNQVTPYGDLSYSQIGKWEDGTPRFQATQTLSPQEQAKQDQQWQLDRLVNQIGIDQGGRIAAQLSQPIDLNNEATESRLMELGRKRLDPVFAQRRSGLETDLINKGITPGSEAYDRELKRLGEQENDAYNQLLLGGRGQAVQEALTQRNQPINEITALMSGGQVSQPNFVGTPTPGVAPVDYTGLVQSNYAGQLNNYNQQVAQKNAMMGGLFGLGSAALGGWGMNGFKKPGFFGV